MNQMFNYFIESSLCLILFYGFYELIQKKEHAFQYDRCYLIGTLLMSLIIPALHISVNNPGNVISSVALDNVIYLPEVTSVKENGTAINANPINWINILIGTYIVGVIFFMARLILSLLKIIKIIANSEKKVLWTSIKTNLVYCHDTLPTCSFFNYIFWKEKDSPDALRDSLIFQHELIHIRQKHSWDILLFEIATVIFWFNPVVHLYKKAIKDVHEYIVDDKMSQTVDKQMYVEALAHQNLRENQLLLIHPFNKSQIMRRIQILEKTWQKINWVKLTLVLPLIVILLGIFSCQTEKIVLSPNLSELPDGWILMTEQDSNYGRIEQDLRDIKEEQPGEYHVVKSDGKSYGFVANENWDIVHVKPLDGTTIAGIARHYPEGDSPRKGPKYIEGFTPPDNIEEVQINADREVYEMVDVHPVPENGMKEFYKYIQQSISYPERAKKDSIQGKVYIQFTVNTDGSVEDVKPVKGIGAGCDEEAIRVIQEGPKWIPGQKNGENVKTQMILPIAFVYK